MPGEELISLYKNIPQPSDFRMQKEYPGVLYMNKTDYSR